MLFLKGKQLKFKRNIAKILKTHGTISVNDFSGNIEKLYDIFPEYKNFSIEFIIKIFNFKLTNYNYESKYCTIFDRYILKCGEKEFSEERYAQYMKHMSVNKQDHQSEKYFQLVYGSGWKPEMQKQKADKNSMYDPEYISKRDNISIEEAKEKIAKFKKEKATSLEGFISRHGESKGKELFAKFQKTSKHTKEKYIKKYGKEIGLLKWKQYTKIKSDTSASSLKYWINKGLSEKEAKKALNKYKEKINSSSVDFWIKKGLSQTEAEQKVADIFEKKRISLKKYVASQESLKVFDEVIDYLLDNNINDYKIGAYNLQEYYIYDKENKKINFYDFTIQNLMDVSFIQINTNYQKRNGIIGECLLMRV